jgi:glutathione synthase/RimK-type ligase-like ATP-grasp enzyme
MNIILSPVFTQFFSGRIWMGLDYERMRSFLEQKHQATVTTIPFHLLIEKLQEVPYNSVLFYSSAYNPDYLQFIQDTVQYIALKRSDIVLIPNEHQLRALENKGYQELYKDLLHIKYVEGKYYGDVNEILDDRSITYPFVLKKLKGALSSGVQLIKSKFEFDAFVKINKKRTFKQSLAYHLNKRNSFNRDSNLKPVEHLLETNFEDFFSKKIPVVVQKFIPGLDCDYKVLIFGDKYFAVKRGIRENDFRASGSGKLQWENPPLEVLDYAREMQQKFKVPFISLDIAIDTDKTCYLFEFQGTAFGPATLTAGKKCFRFENGWKEYEGPFHLEEEYAYALNYFINENN